MDKYINKTIDKYNGVNLEKIIANIKSLYYSSIDIATKYYCSSGSKDLTYHYFNGEAHAYGNVLGYEYKQIEKDIQAAVEKAGESQQAIDNNVGVKVKD